MVLYFQSDACDVCVYVSKYEHVSNGSQLARWGDVGHHHSLSKEGIHIRSSNVTSWDDAKSVIQRIQAATGEITAGSTERVDPA